MVELPPLPPSLEDVHDADQGLALAAVGGLVSDCLDRAELKGKPGSVNLTRRVAFFYLAESLQLMGDAAFLLRPGDEVFTHARGVSGVLRALVDVYARQIAIWNAPDPNQRLLEMLADSTKKERRALDSAASAGVDVRDADSVLAEIESSIGVAASPLNVTSTLAQHEEHELLSVFQWESSLVHLGAAAIAGGGRSVTLKTGQTFDVMLWPVSLWRVAQLTWATYGVGVRLLSLIESMAGFSQLNSRDLDVRYRASVMKSAQRPRPDREPVSPPYGEYGFELYA